MKMEVTLDMGDIYNVSKKACYLAHLYDTRVDFSFNGIQLYAYSESYVGDVAEIYFLKNQLRRYDYERENQSSYS